LLQDVSSWQRVDGVVSGPPCQPDSRIGRQLRETDPRSLVLDAVTRIIADQGRKGAYFFIIEMVPGMRDSRAQQGLPSHYDEWLAKVAVAAPMFRTTMWIVNTAKYLPQQRIRIYTVGTNCSFLAQAPTAPPIPQGPPLRLSDVLALGPELPRDQEARLSLRKKSDLRVLVEVSKDKVRRTSQGRQGDPFWLTFPLDRDMTKKWGSHCRLDGLVETLRTGDEIKWITCVGGHRRFSRCLHPVERLALQGFPASLAAVLSKTALLLHTGNAFSVPVVGGALSVVCNMLHNEGLLRPLPIPRPLADDPVDTAVTEATRVYHRARIHEVHWEIHAENVRAQSLRRKLPEFLCLGHTEMIEDANKIGRCAQQHKQDEQEQETSRSAMPSASLEPSHATDNDPHHRWWNDFKHSHAW
jgi:site-specific DNA-cytosine methylase